MSDAQTQTQTSPAETIGAIYAAFGRGDLPTLFALLHPEVDWSVTVTAPGGDLVPMLRNGIGHPAAQRYFEGVGQLEVHAFDVGRLLVAGDVVVAEVHLEVTHRHTEKRMSLDELHHWVVRDGLVVRYRPYLDTAGLIDLFRP
ncbi:MAG: nuclear transport factor 2 family protein [Actinobacteria bacterium]|nr:nuclear transport factor 2 family protein [Actinomycetota bacterium]